MEVFSWLFSTPEPHSRSIALSSAGTGGIGRMLGANRRFSVAARRWARSRIMGQMPRIHDREAIRAILSADPRWSLYALGDLAPGYFEHSEWYIPVDGAPAVLLLYRAVTPPVLFAAGPSQAVALLAAETAEPAVYLHVQPQAALALGPHYRCVDRRPMLRMALDPSRFRPEPVDHAVRLGTADAARVERA